MKKPLPSSPHVSFEQHPDVREGILTRRTFRTFERRPVPLALRASVLEAARRAPTVGDAEFARYVVSDDPGLKKQLFRPTRDSKDISNHWEALFRSSGLRGYVQDWTYTPFRVAVCADPPAVRFVVQPPVDASMAVEVVIGVSGPRSMARPAPGRRRGPSAWPSRRRGGPGLEVDAP